MIAPDPAARCLPRVIGRFRGAEPGPTVIACGSLHGNEPAGALALIDVAARLREDSIPLRGDFVALAGNRRALAEGVRYVDRDLNRIWTDEERAALANRAPEADDAEGAELRALLAEIDAAVAAARGPVVFLDLHTTSGGGPPFCVMSDTLRNREVALALEVPVILGLEESVDGSAVEYLTEKGYTALCFESGQHADPFSRACHVAVLWQVLEITGAVAAADIVDLDASKALVRRVTRHLPAVVEITYRHDVRPADRFRMRPGYVGFQRIQRGQHLADDRDGPVRAPVGGRILMPLYQPQGREGFFVVRRVGRGWLRVAALARRAGMSRALPYLPGVHPHPERAHAWRVDARLARWFVVQVFHLLGYRKRRREGRFLVFSRRRPG